MATALSTGTSVSSPSILLRGGGVARIEILKHILELTWFVTTCFTFHGHPTSTEAQCSALSFARASAAAAAGTTL